MKVGRGMNKGGGSGRGSCERNKQTRTGGKGICQKQTVFPKRPPLDLFSNTAAGDAKVLNFQPKIIIPQNTAANESNIGAPAPARRQQLPAITAIVDVDSCVLCGECGEACLVGAISVGETVEVNREKCFGCGQCAAVCPANALSLVSVE